MYYTFRKLHIIHYPSSCIQNCTKATPKSLVLICTFNLFGVIMTWLGLCQLFPSFSIYFRHKELPDLSIQSSRLLTTTENVIMHIYAYLISMHSNCINLCVCIYAQLVNTRKFIIYGECKKLLVFPVFSRYRKK